VTFLACLARLQAEKTIDRERADRFAAEYERLRKSYAKSMGQVAAEDLASREAMDALEFQALTERRQKTMQIRTQQNLLLEAQRRLEAGTRADHFAIAVMDHHEAVPGLPSVENTRGAIERLAWSRMDGFFERHGRDMLGRVRNEAELDDVVRALRGERVESPEAMGTANAVRDTFEFLRQQFNAAGGAIAKLKDWGLPQSHDALEVAKAGYAEWRAFILPKLDWQAMTDQTTGKSFASEEALEPALEAAWRNISSQGMDNAVPGSINVRGKLANRHTDHRFFAFRSADDWLAYNQRFGVGSVFDAITGHIHSMSRDIAAMQVLGPNPAATVRWLGDMLRKDALPTVEGGQNLPLSAKAGRGAKTLQDLWDFYSGEMTRISPENRTMARAFSGVRNWNVMSKLGSAFVSALPTDPMFSGVTAAFNGLPVMDGLHTYLKTFNPADSAHRDAALQAGLVFAEMTGRAERLWRDNGSLNTHELTRRGANMLLDATLLTPHTVAAKQAIGLSFMKDWAENADSTFADLAEPKRLALERYGIDAADWDRLRSVPAHEQGSVRLQRPADLARSDDPEGIASAVKFMSLIDAETKFGVPGESLRAATAVETFLGRAERGTIGGEIKHSMAQFKTYSVVWAMTHLERSLYGRGGLSRAQYALTLPIFLTLGGYIADSLIDISKGEVPSAELTPLRLGRAMARGGGLGILGDLVSQGLSGNKGTQGPVSGFLVGPTLGAVIDPITAVTLGNIGAAASGKDVHLTSELIRQARTAVPGSNAWFLRVAMNRLLLDQLQEMADPNYRQSWKRIERSAQERGSTFWWKPGAATPDIDAALQPNPQEPAQP
jgi:hypothetical protein